MRHRPLAVIRAPPSASTAAASVEENSAGREKKRHILEPLPAFASGVYHEGRGNTMFGNRWISTALILACSVFAFGQQHSPDERGVRDLIAHWNAAYRALDAKALA